MRIVITGSCLLVLLISCQNGIEESLFPYTGYYKVISIQTNLAVDLNDDGIKSSDLFQEFSGKILTPDGKLLQFFDFNSPQNFLLIKPPTQNVFLAKSPAGTTHQGIVEINFPDQYLGQLDNGQYYTSFIERTFIGHIYSFQEQKKEFILTSGADPTYDEHGITHSLLVEEDRILKLILDSK